MDSADLLLPPPTRSYSSPPSTAHNKPWMYECRNQWIAPGSLELWLTVETWTRRQLIMVYLPGIEVCASVGGGSAGRQLEGFFTVVIPTTTTAGSTCQKEEVLSLFWPSLFACRVSGTVIWTSFICLEISSRMADWMCQVATFPVLVFRWWAQIQFASNGEAL